MFRTLATLVHAIALLLLLSTSCASAYRIPVYSSSSPLRRLSRSPLASQVPIRACSVVSRRGGAARSRLGLGLGASKGEKEDMKELMDFSGLGELMNNLKKAQDLALEAEEFNKEFAKQSFQGKDDRGLVTATFNGMAEPTGITFTDAVLQLGADTVAAAAMQALSQGHLKAKNAAMQRLQSIMTMPRAMREATFGDKEGFGGPANDATQTEEEEEEN